MASCSEHDLAHGPSLSSRFIAFRYRALRRSIHVQYKRYGLSSVYTQANHGVTSRKDLTIEVRQTDGHTGRLRDPGKAPDRAIKESYCQPHHKMTSQ